ncbi:MAG: signal peptidase II [Bacteroidota bacterium]|nr:signal peptidase II [Bacteroidota bacterium]
MKRKKQLILTLIVLLVNYSLDRITKILATTYLTGKDQLSFFYNTVILKYTENTGAFLSLGSDWPDSVKYILFIILPILVCLYGLYYCAFKLTDKKMIIVFVSMIGGGLGNLIDRLLNDFAVVDFLNFGIGRLRTGILNVADISVTFGVIFLIIDQLVRSRSKAN